ncbi:hypothetical protein MUO83_02260 [Candidatus Bathyarchaeota archaeon]|nr:hypothetical protein [Candidatus Bathyarchaeota archaeon]
MKSLLIRVAIDSGNMGYIGPIDERTMEYVYIPIPTIETALTKRTYNTERVWPRNTVFEGKVLADFMHTDRAEVRLDYDWIEQVWIERKLPANSLKIHFDPEFDGNTYGDSWGNRIPSDLILPSALDEEIHLFFYAGLAPYPKCFEKRSQHQIISSQKYSMNVYVIGHFEIEGIYSIRKEGDLSTFEKELGTNAHFIEKEHLKGLEKYPIKAEREHFSNLVIVKGKKKESRGLLSKAIQLTKWSERKRAYIPTELGEIVGLKPNRGIRQTPHLDSNSTSSLLDEIDSTI